MNAKTYIRKQMLKSIGAVLAVTVVIWLTSQTVTGHLSERSISLATQEGISTLEYTVRQNIRSVNQIIRNRTEYLANWIGAFGTAELGVDTSRLQELDEIRERIGILTMGFISGDGQCLTTDGKTYDLSGYEFIAQGFRGGLYLSESWYSEDEEMLVNTFVIPMNQDEELHQLLLIVYAADDVAAMCGFDTLQKGRGIRLVDSQGRPTVIGSHMNLASDQLEEFQAAEAEGVLKDIAQGGSGYFNYDYQGDRYAIGYAPLGFQDWTVVFYAPYDQIYGNVDSIISLFDGISITLFLVSVGFSLMIGLLIVAAWRGRLKARYCDRITGEGTEQFFTDILLPKWQGEKWLLSVDIDSFKMLNSTYGTQEGDKALREVARAFSEAFPGNVLYRMSADKFFACLALMDRADLCEGLERFRENVRVRIEQNQIPYLKISVGAASCESADGFYRCRIDAMLAKRKIKGRYDEFYRFAEEDIRKREAEEQKVEQDFLAALEKGEIEAWYQPKYDGVLRRPVGAEALVRWRKPDGKLVPPGMFIPVLESSGLMRLLDMEVLRQVCTFQSARREKKQAVLPISVNLSQQYLTRGDAVDEIISLPDTYAVQPGDIIFELTESGLDQNGDTVHMLIQRIHQKGFSIEMDDYGTGISGLKSLSEYDFDTIKLDKTFIDKIGTAKGEKILTGTIRMIDSLEKGIVAEGVETAEQLDYLVKNGCHLIQGYYFSRPLCEKDYRDLMEKEMNKK